MTGPVPDGVFLRAGPQGVWERSGVAWVGEFSRWPELKSPPVSLQLLDQMITLRAEMELQQPSLTWCRCVVRWLAALSADVGGLLQTGVQFLCSMGN